MSISEHQMVAVVTGATRGIGLAAVDRFTRDGWKVISCSRGKPPLAFTQNALWIDHFEVDLSVREEVDDFTRKAVALVGETGLNALVNNAAESPKAEYHERLGCLNGDIDAWREVFELNFFTPLLLSRGFASALHKQLGAIVNVTSIAAHALHPFAGSAYSTSKSALSSLTREMANEFAELGVRVNAVAPGEVRTKMIGPEYDALIPRIPLNRMGTAEEVAAVIYQLCDSEFSYVTGSEIFVTGGQHLF